MTSLLLSLALLFPLGPRPRDELAAGFAAFRAHAEALEASARARPHDVQPAFRLAQGFAERGVLEPALRWAAEAESRGAHPLRLHLLRGDAQRSAGRTEAAIREYFEVVIAAPGNAYAHVRLWEMLRVLEAPPEGLDLARIRKLMDARGYFSPDAAVRPPDPLARKHARKGEAALREGRFADAEANWKAALQLDDALPEAWRGLARTYDRLRQPERAAGAWRLYLALEPRTSRERRSLQRRLTDTERRRGLAAAGASR